MKKSINGVLYDMAPEEIAELERLQAEMPEPEPTPEERLSKVEQRTSDLESNRDEMMEALDMLLSGVTE